MVTMFEKIREFVYKSFKGNPAQMLHFDRTVYWFEQLKPDADEASRIAAVGHDIERAFQDPKEGFGSTNKRFTDQDELKHHQEKGAEILAKFLRDNGASEECITKVKYLVSKHEVGGDVDQNLLKDADSLSFVENNADIFLSRLDKLGYDRVKEKFDWMYNRISDAKAKEIARPFYESMIRKLNQKSGR